MKRNHSGLAAMAGLRTRGCTPGYEVSGEKSGRCNDVGPWQRGTFVIKALACALALAGAHPALAGPDRDVGNQAALPKPGTGNFVQTLIRDLRGRGLEVTVGYPRLYTQADCASSYEVFRNCFGNNPASPYVMPVVKSWPDEYVDPAMVSGFGRTRPGYSATYRLDPREAIIVFGRMPPPARYLGLQTWMFGTKWAGLARPWNLEACEYYALAAGEMTQYFFTTFPPHAQIPHCLTLPDVEGRVLTFSSINNNINNVVMRKQSGDPWDQIRYFVITPDGRTDRTVRDALQALGVEEEVIFTEEIPETFGDSDKQYAYWDQNPNVGPLGLDQEAVDFTTAIRYAMPDDQQTADVWLKSLPLTVLRVRRPSWEPDPEPYGHREAADRPTENELTLRDDLKALIGAVESRARSYGWMLDGEEEDREMIDILNRLGQFGPACHGIGMNCLADGQDASYFFAQPRSLDEGRIYAAVGPLATETGNAIYVGLSVNDASLLKGAVNVDDTKLKGSANSYHSEGANPATLHKFFVHFFARDCDAIEDLTEGHCTTVTADMIPLADDAEAPGDKGLHGMFSMAVRAYMKLGSERGPDPASQLPPHALTFYNQ